MASLAVRVEASLVDGGMRAAQEGDGVVGATGPGVIAMLGSVAAESAAGLRRNVVVARIAQGRHGAAGRPFHLGGAQGFEVVLGSRRSVGHDVAVRAQRVDTTPEMFGMQP